MNLESGAEFMDACISGDIESAKLHINNVNIKFDEGQTPLMEAAENCFIDIVELLIKNGANVDATNDNGETALLKTIHQYNNSIARDIIDLLIKNSDNLDIMSNDGDTPLTSCACHNDTVTIKLLIVNGASIDLGDSEDGETALMCAARFNNKDSVTLLIDEGANIDLKDKSGKSALIKAVEYESYDSLEVLVDNNAQLFNNNFKTALYVAIEKDDFISMVLLKKELLNEQDENGNTLLLKSCKYKEDSVIEFLVKKGADYHIENNAGESILSILESKDVVSGYAQAFKEKLLLDELLDQRL